MYVRMNAAAIAVAVVLAMFATVASASDAAEDQPPQSVFVALAIGDKCHVAVREMHNLPTPPPHKWHAWDDSFVADPKTKLVDLQSKVPVPPSSTSTDLGWENRFIAVAEAADGQRTKAYAFSDPRFIRLHQGHHSDVGDGEHDAHRREDHVHEQMDATEHIWVPADTTAVHLYCRNASVKHRIPVHVRHHSRRFSALVDNTIEVRTMQQAGPPKTQTSVVFIAGGFTMAQKEIFFANATTLTQLLSDPALDPFVEDPEPVPEKASMRRSVPFNRYWSFWNVYAVFQASNQAGASFPGRGIFVDNNLKCEHPAGLERAPFCDRHLAVALADVSPAAAKEEPGRVVIITIINTPEYGGSGLYIRDVLQFGNFFNGYDMSDTVLSNKMMSLVDHEIGHAFGNLGDEYDTGRVEPTDRYISNCQIGSGGGAPASPRWQHWIDLFSASGSVESFRTTYGNGVSPPPDGRGTATEWTIATTPVPVCGFTNYFKPAQNCMMQKLDNYFMCPVCRESSTLASMRHKFLYSWPRWPLADTVTIVPNYAPPANGGDKWSSTLWSGSYITLHLPVQLSGPGFTVTWRNHNGSVLPKTNSITQQQPGATVVCPACVDITPEIFDTFPLNQVVTISATIVDDTVFLSNNPSVRTAAINDQLNQVAYFKFIKTDRNMSALGNTTAEAGVIRHAVGESNHDQKMVWVQCPPGNATFTPICSQNFTNKQYAAPAITDPLAEYNDWVIVGMVAMACLLMFFWVLAAQRYGKMGKGRVRPIFTVSFHWFIRVIRYIMLGSAICFMLASVTTMGLATYYYTQVSAIGRYIIIAGVCLALGLYVLAFIGFWAVKSRSTKMLVLNALMLVVGLGVLIAISTLITQIGEDIVKDDSPWTNRLRDFWQDMVADNPGQACEIQQWLKCSGFEEPCTKIVGSTIDCPRKCDANLDYPAPCRDVIRKYINDNYGTTTTIVNLCIGLLCLGIVFNIIQLAALIHMKRDLKKNAKRRIHSVASMRTQQKQPERKHNALFLLKSLDKGDTQKLRREFQRIDVDGNGELEKRELNMFFRKALGYKPTLEELNEIVAIADIDGNGTISFDEFLSIFGSGSAEEHENELAMPLKKAESRRKIKERMQRAGLADYPTHPTPMMQAGRGALQVPQKAHNHDEDVL